MIFRMSQAVFAAASTLALTAPAGAYDPARAPRYGSPDMFRPNVDQIILRGRGSTGDVSTMSAQVPGGTVPRTLADFLGASLSPKDFGAKCDGVTDDTAALTAWANLMRIAKGLYRAPAGTCVFSAKLTFNMLPGSQLEGAGAYATTFKYVGADTTTDLMLFGGTSQVGGTGYFGARGFRVISGTKMTAGVGIRVKNVSFVNLRDVVSDGQGGSGNLWNGIWFDETGYNVLDGFDAGYVQNDGLMVSGPGVLDGTHPQFDFYGINGKVGKVGGCAYHVGGGFDGSHLDKTMLSSSRNAICIDTAITGVRNQEVYIGEDVSADLSTGDAVVINDAKTQDDDFYCHIDLRAQITNAKGNGVNVISWPSCYINVTGPTISHHDGDGIRLADASTKLTLSPTTRVVRNGGYGIHATQNTTALSLPGRGNVENNTAGNFSPTIVGNGRDTTPGRIAASISPTGSPFTVPITEAGTLYVDGANVTAITLLRPFSTAIPTGLRAGPVTVRAGDSVQITYSLAPRITFVPN